MQTLGNEIVPKLCLVNGIKLSRLLLAHFRRNTRVMKSTRARCSTGPRFQSFQKNIPEKTKMIWYFIRTQLSTNGGWLHNLHLYFLRQVILVNEKILNCGNYNLHDLLNTCKNAFEKRSPLISKWTKLAIVSFLLWIGLVYTESASYVT